MSFTQDTFASVGAQAANSPKLYTYSTSDSLAAVIATGYFILKKFELQEGGLIIAEIGAETVILKVEADTSTVMQIDVGLGGNSFAEYHLLAVPQTFLLNDDGTTYTKIPGMVAGFISNFSVASGTLTHNGASGVFLLNMSADVEVNKAADCEFTVFVEGSAVADKSTVITFAGAARVSSLAIVGMIALDDGDEVEVHARGDGTAGISLSVDQIDLTLLRVQ